MKNVTTRGFAYDPIAELVRVNPVPSIIMDMQTLTVALVNQAVLALLGYSEDELVGHLITDFVPHEDVAAVEKAADEPPPEGETQWRCFRKDGAIVYVKLRYRETVYQGKRARFVVAAESRLTPFGEKQ
ncbi:MAG TPA: PAS domain-containing protein [Candidatus Angelobacter sp.]